MAAAASGGDASLKQHGAFGRTRRSQVPPNASYFGLTLVSCEHADIRQPPGGLMVYDDNSQWEIQPPLHSARWAKATLEVSLAVLESAPPTAPRSMYGVCIPCKRLSCNSGAALSAPHSLRLFFP
jgi:hypothetical protein